MTFYATASVVTLLAFIACKRRDRARWKAEIEERRRLVRTWDREAKSIAEKIRARGGGGDPIPATDLGPRPIRGRDYP